MDWIGSPKVEKKGKRLLTTLEHKQCQLICQLDTASARNVMSWKDYENMGKPPLRPSNVTLVSYDGSEMKSKGVVETVCTVSDRPLHFEVVDTAHKPYPLLGLDACLELGLVDITTPVHAIHDAKITKLLILDKYDDVFKGLGEMPGEYEIVMDETVTPVQHRPRRTPVMMRDDIIKKIEELEKLKIISRVEEPTPWIS